MKIKLDWQPDERFGDICPWADRGAFKFEICHPRLNCEEWRYSVTMTGAIGLISQGHYKSKSGAKRGAERWINGILSGLLGDEGVNDRISMLEHERDGLREQMEVAEHRIPDIGDELDGLYAKRGKV